MGIKHYQEKNARAMEKELAQSDTGLRYYTPFAYPPPPTHREILKKGQVCPYTFCCYINGWCFLDLKWTFYRALLPIYIKKDSGVFVTDLARADLLTDSCQVFVLQLYLCNDSVDG